MSRILRSNHNHSSPYQLLLQQQQQQELLAKKKGKKGVSLRVLLGEQTTSKEMLYENGLPLVSVDDDDDMEDADEEGEGEEDNHAHRHLPGLQNRLLQRFHQASLSSSSSSSGAPISSPSTNTTTTTFVREISPGVITLPKPHRISTLPSQSLIIEVYLLESNLM